jgi:hypothetical protein
MNYVFSQDYEALFNIILKGFEIVGYVKTATGNAGRPIRTPCVIKRTAPFEIKIYARGFSYGEINNYMEEEYKKTEKELFLIICEDCNLEWIVP